MDVALDTIIVRIVVYRRESEKRSTVDATVSTKATKAIDNWKGSVQRKVLGNRSVPPSGANFAGKGLMIVKHVAIPGHLRMLVIHEGACCEPCGLLS